MRGLYLNLYQRIFKIEGNKERYYDAIASYISDLHTKDEIPSDNTFLKNLKNIDLYKQHRLAKFLLAQVENNDSKEFLLTEDMSVEHIMHQTLSNAWISMLGEDYYKIHEEYLHTLGNLSLTGYNSSMGNKSFDSKKETLKSKSKANFLNQDVLDKENWTEAEIKLRAERLSQTILSIFKPDRYNSRNIRFEKVNEYTFDVEYEDIKGEPMYSYKFMNMDVEHRIKSYKLMLIEIIQTLDNVDSKIMDDIANDIFNPWPDSKYDRLSYTVEHAGNRTIVKIRDNLYLIGGFSGVECIYSIKKLMTYYNISEDQFLFYTRKQD